MLKHDFTQPVVDMFHNENGKGIAGQGFQGAGSKGFRSMTLNENLTGAHVPYGANCASSNCLRNVNKDN
jgi:hypothetical protein